MNDLVNGWNNTVSGFEIKNEDLTRPTSTFFIDALVKLLELLDFQLDDVVRHKCKPANVPPESWEAFQELVPLVNLCETVNYVLAENLPDCEPITLADLMTPSRYVVEKVLLMLYNFYLFVKGQRESVAVKEDEVQERVEAAKMALMEMDQLKIEIDQRQLENNQLESETHKMEKSAKSLKIKNMDTEQRKNALKAEYAKLMEEINDNVELKKQQALQATLVDEISKLKLLILSDEKQAEVTALLESASQNEKELEENLEEIKTNLWKKEADIKTFETLVVHLNESQILLDNLSCLFENINGIEKSSESHYEKEIEFNRLNENMTMLNNKIEHLSKIYNQLNTDRKQMEKDAEKEAELYMSEKQNSDHKNKIYEKEINDIYPKIQKIKAATVEYNKKYEIMLNSYVHEIPQSYDIVIQDYISKIEDTLREVNNIPTRK